MTTAEHVRELIHRSWNTPDGAGRILLAEQALDHAEALGDPDLAYTARAAVTTAYHQGGEPMKAMTAFARCVADYDADPGRRSGDDESLLLWQFKSAASSMARFPEVPLDRTLAVLDDMQRRYQAGGHSLHAVYASRHGIAAHLGDTESADHWYRMWDTAPRDGLSDCAGCDPASKAYHHAWRGRDGEAIAVAEAALTGEPACSGQPCGILTALLLPYLRTGRLDEARDAHRRAYRALSDNKANLESVARHIEFCALTGNEPRGLELIERHLPWLEQAPSPMAEMEFAASSALVLRRLAETGQGHLAVRRAGGDTTAAALGTTLRERATAIAARFDARNGNTFSSERIAARLAASPLVDHLPLSVTAVRRPRPADRAAGAPAAPPADLSAVPATLTLDEQLDAVEDLIQQEDEPRADALAVRILSRFGDVPLSDLQRGRMARLKAVIADDEDLATEAAVLEEAVTAFVRAGDRDRELATRVQWAMALFQLTGEETHHRDALTAVEQTLELGRDPRVRRDALVRAGYLSAVIGDLDRALDFLAQAEAEPGPVPVRRRARITYLRAGIHQGQERTDEAIAGLRQTADLLRPLGPGDKLAGTLLALARMLGGTGDNAGTLAAFEEAARVAVDPELRRSARADAGFMLVTTDRAAEVIDDVVEHVRLMEAQGAPGPAAYTRHRLALGLATTGRHRESAEVAEEALAWFTGQPSGDHRDIVIELRNLLSRVYAALDEPHVAIGQLNALSELVTGLDELPLRADILERAGELLWQVDRDAEAAQRFDAAAQAYGQADLPLATVHARRRYVMALHHAGQHEESLAAAAHLEALLAVTEVPQDQQAALVWERATAGYEAVQILTRSDTPDYEAALARIAPVAGLYRSIEGFIEAAHAELRHGQVLVLAGRPDTAEPLLRRVMSELPGSHGSVPEAASWLARVLDLQGDRRRARRLRKEHGLPEPE